MDHIAANVEILQDDMAKLKGDVYGQNPDSPGLSMRLYRIEQNLIIGWKFAVVLVPGAIVWRLLDFFLFNKPPGP